MSFHRVSGPLKKKKAVKKKPTWDDSVHDLTVYRATPQEVLMRKEAHKSKNHMSIKLEKMKAEQQNFKLSGADLQKLAIMKEVLYDQHQLQQVLAKSDSMMAVVKDMFGDDPKRSVGFPNVTTAPQSQSASSSLVYPVPDFQTRSEKMSASVMDQSAINDVENTDSEDDDGTERPEPISYKSKLNLQHFHDYLIEEERKIDHLNPPTLVEGQSSNQPNKNSNLPSETDGAKLSQMISLIEQGKLTADLLTQNPQQLAALLSNVTDSQNLSDFQTPPRSCHLSQRSDGASPPTAINDTQRVNKTKRQTGPVDENKSNTSMTDMRLALKELEGELAAYEHQTGRTPMIEEGKTDNFSGYTVALVSAVSKLTRYLKETELRVKTEVTLREQLTQDVYQLRAIIDALASDLIMTQEEYAKLYSENQRYRETTAAELASMNKHIVELQTVVSAQLPKGMAGRFGDHSMLQHHEHSHQEAVNMSQKSQTSFTSTPNQGKTEVNQAPSSVGAILLSPVVRKTRVHSFNAVHPDLTVSTSSHSSDPPQLTQAPPVMKSISVPRPISLVQSNLPVPLTSLPTPATASESGPSGYFHENGLGEIINHEKQSLEQLQQLQELDVEDVLQNPALQDLMQTQIAELNRQQEEARKRLRDLLANQKLQQQHLQQSLGPEIALDLEDPPGYLQQHQNVSPPISPISTQSDRPALRDVENLPQKPRTKGITLTLPMADLDVSGGSLSSPTRSQDVKSTT